MVDSMTQITDSKPEPATRREPQAYMRSMRAYYIFFTF